MSEHLARKSFLIMISRFFTPVLGLIALVLVKRYLGYEAIGMLAFAFSFVAMFSFLSDLGLSNAHTKKSNEKGMDEGKCNGTFVTLKLILAFVAVFAVFSFLFIQKHFFNYEFENQIIVTLIIIGTVRLFLLNIKSIYATMTTSKTEIAALMVPTVLSALIKFLLKIIFLVLGFGIVSIAGAEFIGTLLLVILFFYFIRYPISKPDWIYIRKYVSFAIPVAFIGFVLIYSKNIDKVMLHYFLDSEAVGVYVIPQRILEATLVVSTGVIALLFPTFSKLFDQQDKVTIQKLTNKSVKYISLCLVPIYLSLFLFGSQILQILFGPDSTVSFPVLKVFIIISYLNAIRLPYTIQMISAAYLGYAFWISFCTLLINTVLNLYFIPDEFWGIKTLGFGILGAAYTTFFAVLINFFLVIIASYKISRTLFYFPVLKHIGVSVFLYLIFIFFGLEDTFSPFSIVFFFFAVTTLFIFILWLIGEIDDKDINFFIDTVNPKKMIAYVKSMK